MKSALAAGLLLIAGAFYYSNAGPVDAGADSGDGGTAPDILDGAQNMLANTLNTWQAPDAYAATVAQAEADNGIPAGLLCRLLYQECHWRPDIISGATASPAGAQGVAQFMPATAAGLGIDPLDPLQAIPAAAGFLSRLYARFGDWRLALAAYNWGPGNVASFIATGKGAKGQPMPAETVNYMNQIGAAVGLA